VEVRAPRVAQVSQHNFPVLWVLTANCFELPAQHLPSIDPNCPEFCGSPAWLFLQRTGNSAVCNRELG